MKKTPSTFWAMMCHLLTYLGFLFPLFSLLAPLVLWVYKRDEDPLIMKNGRNVINFVLSFWIYTLGILAAFIIGLFFFFPALFLYQSWNFHSLPMIEGYFFSPLIIFYGICCCIYAVLYALFHLVLPFYGALKALNGEVYRYPLTIPFLKESELDRPQKIIRSK